MDYQGVIDQQRLFFNTNTTKDISFRIRELKKLKNVLQKILYTPGYRVPRENCNSQSFQFYNCIIKQSQKKQRMAAIIFS